MEPKNQYCKKLAYGKKEDPSIILGIIVNETDKFIVFRTARKEYIISKNCIVSIEDTFEIFRKGD